MKTNQNKTFCLGGRHFSQTLNENVYEKLNPNNEKLVKLSKEPVVFAVVLKIKFLLSEWLKAKILLKEEIVKIITVRLCQIQHGMI